MNCSKLKLTLGLIAATLLLAGATNAVRADDTDTNLVGEASSQEKTFASELMQSTKDEDYKAFLANGDKGFHSIKEKMFKSVCGQITPRLKKGYHVVFLGGFKQEGSHVTLWKIAYDDGGDEDLLHLSVKADKINGALITAAFQ